MKQLLAVFGLWFAVCVNRLPITDNRLFGDIVYLNNGEEYEGRVIKIEKNTLWGNIKGKIKKWTTDEVQRIEFEELHTAQWIKELGDPLLDSLWKYAPDTLAYPDAQWVTLYEKVRYYINPDSSWEKATRKIQKLLNPGGRWIASKSFYYLSKSEQLNIKSAKVIHPNGRLNWLREAATKDESIYSEFPTYENKHKKRFALPEIPLGGICDVEVEQTFPKANIEHPLVIEESFRDWEPVEYKFVEIACPVEMELVFFKSAVIESNTGVVPQVGMKFYEFWKAKSDKIEKESWLPPLPDLSPRVLVGIKDRWEAIGDKYYKLIEPRLTYGDELINKLNELSSSVTQDFNLDIALQIYNFVATEIKPIPITKFDEYSWIPSSTDSVFKNKFGSLPDRVLLLYGMLKKAGFSVYLVLISPHENGKRIKEVPSLGQIPSSVVKLELGDSTYWLCPFDDCTAFGELPPEYQGGLALKLIPEGSELIDVPIFPPNKELVEKKIYAKLNSNGDLSAKQSVILYGNLAGEFREKKSLKPEELKKWFEKEVARIHPSAELIEFNVSDLANLKEPVSYQLNYQIKNYAVKSGEKFLTFNLPGIMYTAEEVGKPKRANPIDFGLKEMRVNQIEIEIPDGYKIYYLPPSYKQVSEVASYEAKFIKKMPNFAHRLCAKLLGNSSTVLFSDRYLRLCATASSEDYYDYKECIETKAKLAKEWIVLQHK